MQKIEDNGKYKVHSSANRILTETAKGTLEKDFSSKYVYVPKRKKPFNKKIPASFILIIFIMWLANKNLKALYSNKYIKAKDVLTELKRDRPICERLDRYVHYILSRFERKGVKGLEWKWASEAPDYLKKASVERLKKLIYVRTEGIEGFKVEKIYMDNNAIYVVKCVTFAEPSRAIFIYVLRERIGGHYVFRLWRAD